jgi:NO-binding membrane sensor protein with MHYT domain
MMIPAGTLLTGSYDPLVVTLSVVIAVAASYAALDLAGRVTASKGWSFAAWLTCSSIAMGIGIWSMHFTGMLAFSLPVPVSYDWPTVLLSYVVAVLAAILALYVVSRKEMSSARAVGSGAVMGSGIAALHYMDMAAVRMAADGHFNSLLVALSVAFAMAFSYSALRLAFILIKESRGWSSSQAKPISPRDSWAPTGQVSRRAHPFCERGSTRRKAP